MEITPKSSQSIRLIRAFAIFSVICAHCHSVNPEYSFSNIFAASALRSFGSVGVGVFLLLWGGRFLFDIAYLSWGYDCQGPWFHTKQRKGNCYL